METNSNELLRENAELRARLEKIEKSLYKFQSQNNRPDQGQRKDSATARLEVEIAERKRVERALRESEYRYRTLFNQMSEGFALCDVVFDSENEPGDLRLIEINPALEQLSGLKRSDLIGKTIRQALPKSQLGWVKTCSKVGLDGKPVHLERYSDSYSRHFEISAFSPVSGSVACLFRDITHRKRAEAALHEVQERLQMALDSTELGTFDFELQTGRLVWSKFAKPHFSLPDGVRAAHQTFLRAIHPEDRPRIQRILREVRKPASNEIYAAEYRTAHANGKMRWISAQGRVIFDVEGRPVRILGAMLDITQRKQMEQERQELLTEFQRQRSLLAAILNQMPIGVTVAESPSGRILLTNAALERIFGSGVDYERGLECYRKIHATDANGRTIPAGEWPLVRSIRNKETTVDKEIQIRCPQGVKKVLSASAAPVIDQEGKMVAGVSLMIDITERTRMQQALRESREKLEETVAQRTAELHEVNKTLRMISQCDKALAQATDETKLIHTICKLIYKLGIFQAVGVAFAEQDEAKTIRPVAAVGIKAEVLFSLKLSWAEGTYGKAPAARAIRSGEVCVGKDFLTEETLAPWRELAIESGIRSSIAFPLMDGSSAFGVLSLFSAQPSASNVAQVNLLKELANNLAFGILALRARVQRDEGVRRLEQNTAQLRALASELTRVEEKERQRLAQLLHDDLQQSLMGARFQLSRLLPARNPCPAPEPIEKADRILRECIETTRSLTSELSPPALFEPDFGVALMWLGERFKEKHGLTVKITFTQTVLIGCEELRLTLFRAVRELLFNAVKHSKVTRVTVNLRLDKGQIRVVVSDRGIGFDPAHCHNGKTGFGLLHLKERIASFGELQIEAAPGRGS